MGIHCIHQFQLRCSIADCLLFYTAMLNILLIGSQNRWHKRDLGAHVKILTGMLVLSFGFEIWPNPIFLGWQIFSYFSRFCSISAIFLGLTNFQLFLVLLVCPPPPLGKEMALHFCIIAPRGHSITKDTGGWLEGLSQKPQNIYPKIAIFY